MANRTRILLRSMEALNEIQESKLKVLRISYDSTMKMAVDEAGIIYDPNVVEWVELHVESSDLHNVWTLALTLYFEGEPQVDIAKSLGVALWVTCAPTRSIPRVSLLAMK